MKYANFLYQLLFVSLVLSSCGDFLDEAQDNRTAIDRPSKVAQLLTNAYTNAQYAEFAESMSDNADDRGPGAHIDREINAKAYRWEDFESTASESTSSFWVESYLAIAHANQALASIEELGGGPEYSSSRGEALLARAYAHFMLVNFFSMRYDPTTADVELGVPYVLDPEKNALKSYKRSTVAEVYRLVEKDLEEGLKLVGSEYEEPRFHFTLAAAGAFATRFYLYKGDWEKVIDNANAILGTNASGQVRDYVSRSVRTLTYSQQADAYSSSGAVANLLVSWTSSVYGRTFWGNRYAMSTNIRDSLFDGTHPFMKSWGYRVFGTDLALNKPKYDEYFRVTNVSAGTGIPHASLVHFTTDEVLLNRAEAYAMMGEFDMSLSDLQGFLSKKTLGFSPATDVLTMEKMEETFPNKEGEYSPFYALNVKQAVVIKGIAEFRRREFYHEGLRWLDIKRFDIVVTHNLVQEGIEIVLWKGDLRRAIQIPESARQFKITENKR